MKGFEMFKYLHTQSATSCNRLNQYLMFSAILISVITNIGIFSSLGIKDSNLVINTMCIFAIIVFFLQAVREFYNPKATADKHTTNAKEYTILMDDINEQLTKDVSNRENVKDFMKKIGLRFNELIVNGPPISKKNYKIDIDY